MYNGLIREGKLRESPIIHQIAAISAGVVEGTPCLDLCYTEDSSADTDMNFVMNEQGEFIELQGTGEGCAFSRDQLNTLLDLGESGCRALMQAQREALGDAAALIAPKQKLILASNNAHKILELSAMLGGKYDVLSMRDAGFTDEIIEDGETFEENARIKAEAVMRATGYLTLADDSDEDDMLVGSVAAWMYRARGNTERAALPRNLDIMIKDRLCHEKMRDGG